MARRKPIEPEEEPSADVEAPPSEPVSDPWAAPCPRCGLLGCQKGHT